VRLRGQGAALVQHGYSGAVSMMPLMGSEWTWEEVFILDNRAGDLSVQSSPL